jgi:hypothetical protein
MRWFTRKERAPVPAPVAAPPRPRMFIPQSVLAATERLLASAREHEQVVYWAGIEGPGVSAVLTCIAPEAATTYGSFDTSAASNAVVINWIAERGLVHLAQLHCHPDHRVGHSAGDDRGALMPFENFVSIVVPHYGNVGIGSFEHSGVHRYESGRFVRLSAQDVATTLTVVPDSANFRDHGHADLS